MGLPVLCVATAIFLLWGMQNFSRNPVPSICIMLGTVGLSYYLLVSAHYHKTATSVVVGALILFCGRAVQKDYFRKSCLYEEYKQLLYFYKSIESDVTSSFIMKGRGDGSDFNTTIDERNRGNSTYITLL